MLLSVYLSTYFLIFLLSLSKILSNIFLFSWTRKSISHSIINQFINQTINIYMLLSTISLYFSALARSLTQCSLAHNCQANMDDFCTCVWVAKLLQQRWNPAIFARYVRANFFVSGLLYLSWSYCLWFVFWCEQICTPKPRNYMMLLKESLILLLLPFDELLKLQHSLSVSAGYRELLADLQVATLTLVQVRSLCQKRIALYDVENPSKVHS